MRLLQFCVVTITSNTKKSLWCLWRHFLLMYINLFNSKQLFEQGHRNLLAGCTWMQWSEPAWTSEVHQLICFSNGLNSCNYYVFTLGGAVNPKSFLYLVINDEIQLFTQSFADISQCLALLAGVINFPSVCPCVFIFLFLSWVFPGKRPSLWIDCQRKINLPRYSFVHVNPSMCEPVHKQAERFHRLPWLCLNIWSQFLSRLQCLCLVCFSLSFLPLPFCLFFPFLFSFLVSLLSHFAFLCILPPSSCVVVSRLAVGGVVQRKLLWETVEGRGYNTAVLETSSMC